MNSFNSYMGFCTLVRANVNSGGLEHSETCPRLAVSWQLPIAVTCGGYSSLAETAVSLTFLLFLWVARRYSVRLVLKLLSSSEC
jgi:hypothetical protein